MSELKLTTNQNDLKKCLTKEYIQLKYICDKYAVIQGKKGFSKRGWVYKGEVSRIIQALIVKGVAEKGKRGFYRLKQ